MYINCKIVHVCADLGIVVEGGGGGGAEQHGKVDIPQQRGISGKSQRRIQRGGGGGQGFPHPPGKSQVIWGFIENKQLDTSLESVASPPHLEKVGPPPEP